MRTRKYLQATWRITMRVGFVLVMVAVLLANYVPAAAQAPVPDVEPAAPTEADDGSLEVGVHWVEKYNPTNPGCVALPNLPATRPDALGLCSKLSGGGYSTPAWICRYRWGDGNAWEEDWKRAALGGTEESWVDTVDLAYFAGHGSSSGFYFGKDGCLHDDYILTYNDAYQAWGTKDMDWAGIAACNVLDDPHRRDWSWAMSRLRLLLGMKTTMDDAPFGLWFGHYIRLNYTMTQAWFAAADRCLSHGVIARVLAEENAYFNDRYFNHTSGSMFDSTYWYRDHLVGSEPARYVDPDLVTEMPVYKVKSLTLQEAQSEFGQVGTAFGLTSTTPVIATSSTGGLVASAPTEELPEVWESSDGQLTMDPTYGLYGFTETANLWTAEDAQAATSAGMMSISSDGARKLADDFLRGNNLMPGDAQFFEVATESQGTIQREVGAAGESLLAETPTNYEVIYSRILTYTPVSAAGVQMAPVEFSVMGPGSKMKVYVAPEAVLNGASVLEDPILGGVGGYRAVNQVAAAEGDAPALIPVLPESQILTLFDKVEPIVALSYTPVPFTSREVLSTTLAYWEGYMGWEQDELIPVYALTVRAQTPDNPAQTYVTYIPVNSKYMAPYARITKPVETPLLLPGSQIALEAADASKTLAELGVDPSLNFVLGTGDPASYQYWWYRDVVSDATLLGTGRTLNYTTQLTDIDMSKSVPGMKIILRVVDSASTRDPKVSTDLAAYTNVLLHMPLIQK